MISHKRAANFSYNFFSVVTSYDFADFGMFYGLVDDLFNTTAEEVTF
jgi:hypothetical protein